MGENDLLKQIALQCNDWQPTTEIMVEMYYRLRMSGGKVSMALFVEICHENVNFFTFDSIFPQVCVFSNDKIYTKKPCLKDKNNRFSNSTIGKIIWKV